MNKTSGHIASIGILSLIALTTANHASYGCGGDWDVACNVGEVAKQGYDDAANTAKKAVDDTINTGKKAVDDTASNVAKSGKDVGDTAKKALDDAATTAKKAVDDGVLTAKKAVDDYVWNYMKAANDAVDAGTAVARYVGRQINGYGDTLTDAQKRIREGKVVDAFWHASTDQYRHTDENAARATQESEVINEAASAAASTYGGPAGAAAYAAWYTYHKTGNADLALRAGIITGVTSAGYASASALPADSVGQVAKKAIVTGAVGGAAVAAGGGDKDAVRDAFLKSGGMVVVQSGQSYVTKKYVDPAAAKADTYCMSAIGTKCSVVLSKVQRGADGKVLLDDKGNPKIDTSAILPDRTQIGEWDSTPEQAAKDAQRKVAGASAMLVSDGQWAISWDKAAFTSKTSKTPAVVVTYSGPQSPLGDKLHELESLTRPQDAPGTSLAKLSEKNKQTNCLSSEQTWVALNDFGNPASFFDRLLPGRTGAVSVGEVTRANRNVGITSGPPNLTPQPGSLPQKTIVSVTETTQQTDTQGRSRDWARVEVVETNDANTATGPGGSQGCQPATASGAVELLGHLANLPPTLGPPLWKMMPNSIWYVYAGTVDGARRCWSKGTLITNAAGEAHGARIFVAPYPLPSSPPRLAARLEQLKVSPNSNPALDIDGTKVALAPSEDGILMLPKDSEAEARAIALMKAKSNVTLVATAQDGHTYKFLASLSDFAEALRLITQECS